jgi:predicted DNA-binding transcriptional regulator YafY
VVAGQYGSEYLTSCVTYCGYRGRVRASRLVSLLGLLQARGRMSTRQLAAELEVCERTVLRDIEALSTAGIPVYATRGRHGGFELMDGFSSDLVGGRRRGEAPPGPLAAGDGVQRALIRLSPRGRRLAALLGRPAGLHIRRHAAPVPGRSDWAEGWVRIDSLDAAVPDLLALGAEVEVMHPPELRAQMAQVAGRIAARHAEHTGASRETGAESAVG